MLDLISSSIRTTYRVAEVLQAAIGNMKGKTEQVGAENYLYLLYAALVVINAT